MTSKPTVKIFGRDGRPLQAGDELVSFYNKTYVFERAYMARSGAVKVLADGLIFDASAFVGLRVAETTR